MAVVGCKDCGKEISSEAKACPSCGCPVKAPGGHIKGILFVLAIVVIGFLAYGLTIPENERRAVEVRNACLELAKQGSASPENCYKMEGMIKRGEM